MVELIFYFQINPNEVSVSDPKGPENTYILYIYILLYTYIHTYYIYIYIIIYIHTYYTYTYIHIIYIHILLYTYIHIIYIYILLYTYIHIIYISLYMSQSKTKPIKWHMCPANTQISLGISPVWSDFLLSTWRKFGSLATHWAHSEDSDQTGWIPRLIWVFAGLPSIL